MVVKIKNLLCLSVVTIVTNLSAHATQGLKFSIGGEGQYYHYREPNVMHLNGWMVGLNSETAYTYCNQWLIGADVRLLWGQANYSSYETGKLKNEPQSILETRALFGREFTLESGSTLTPYSGLGYRFKKDSDGNGFSTTGHYSYRRRSHYFYLPLGLKYDTSLTSEWGMTVKGEYDQLLYGHQESDVRGGTLEHDQHHGFGLKASLDFTRKLSKRSISFGPYIHFWNIKDSEHQIVFNINKGRYVNTLEPRNRTVETGISAKYHF